MKKIISTASFIFPLIFIIHSCVTINIYFPAAAVEKAADRIVEEVWGDKQGTLPEDKSKQKGDPQGFIEQWLKSAFTAIGPSEATAEEADINITTPSIRALKEAIKQRAESIKPYMDNGNVGLSNEGLLVVRSSEGMGLKDKAGLTRILKAENRDRNSLYSEIAKANNFSKDRVSDIKKIFARSWIRQAKKGWWVQAEDGEWSRKE